MCIVAIGNDAHGKTGKLFQLNLNSLILALSALSYPIVLSIIGPSVHCTYCVPLCSLIGPIVTIVTPVIRLHNHITVGPHTKCGESVLSMTHL